MRTLLLAAALAVVSSGAHSANCGLRTEVVERLQTKYSETLIAGGLQGTKNVQTMVEVWASVETGTFTVILTNAQGVSCVVATGTDFFNRNTKPEKPGIEG